MNAEAYGVFGLRLKSELALPELNPPPAHGDTDVEIVTGTTPRFANEPSGLSVHDSGALLLIEGVGRYWMERGSRMTVEPASDGAAPMVRLFLLGSALAAILHQRGLLPIHANGVVLEGRAVCFIGHSGAGKSTLAAWFHDRGLALLADDVCVISEDEAGRKWVQPGIPRLRLTGEALGASGRLAAEHAGVFDGHSKYNLAGTSLASGPVPLSHFYLLVQGEPGEAARIRPLRGVAALEALVANTYRGGYVPLMGRTAAHLAQCADLTRAVPLFEARRPWDLASLDAVGTALERHAIAVAAG